MHGRALEPRLFGKRDEQNRIRDRDADGHDRAHERLHIQRRARDEQHQQYAAHDRGDRRDDGYSKAE